MVTGIRSQPGKHLIPALDDWPTPVTSIGRHETATALDTIITDLETDTAPLSIPAPAPALLHLAPIWLLPPLLSRWPSDNPPSRIIGLSSISARTKAESEDVHERALSNRLCQGESDAVNAAAAHGRELLILRCTLIYGVEGAGVIGWLANQGRRFGCIPLPPAANGLRQPVHAGDIAAALQRLVVHPHPPIGVHDLGGGERLGFRAMARRIPRADGKPCRVLTVPTGVLRLLLARRGEPGAGAAVLNRLASDQVAESDEIWNATGLRPRSFRP